MIFNDFALKHTPGETVCEAGKPFANGSPEMLILFHFANDFEVANNEFRETVCARQGRARFVMYNPFEMIGRALIYVSE